MPSHPPAFSTLLNSGKASPRSRNWATKTVARAEMMVDISYVFDLVLDNTNNFKVMKNISSPNDVKRLQSLVSDMEKGYKAMQEDKS
jgi:hypothetical protein